jgi:hypothetical protein
MGGRQALLKDFLGEDLITDSFGKIPTSGELWGVLKLRLENKQLIPIISNSVSLNHIFDTENNGQLGISYGGAEETEEHLLLLDELLARQWAEFIGYPLAENPLQLSQIAQFNQVTSLDSDQAKMGHRHELCAYLKHIGCEGQSGPGA